MKDRFLYVFQKQLANDVTLRECSIRNGQCKAHVNLKYDDQFIVQANEDTPSVIKNKSEIVKVKVGLKRTAITRSDTNRQVLAVEPAVVTETAVENLPSMESLKRRISNARAE